MAYTSGVPLTLRLLWQDLGRVLREITVGNVDSATSTTFTDSELVDAGESETAFDRAWVKVGTNVRRVSSYDEATGTITVSRAFTNLPVAGDEYEIHTMLSPTELNECINRALTQAYYSREEAIPIVADQTEYDLSSYGWIFDAWQVMDVSVRVGDTANEYRYLHLPWWKVLRKSATEATSTNTPFSGMYLKVRPLGDTSSALVITALCPYATLSSDTLATPAPYEWIMAMAEYQVYDLQIRDAPSTDRKVYEDKLQLIGRRVNVLNRTYMPRPTVRVMHPDSTYGLVGAYNLQDES